MMNDRIFAKWMNKTLTGDKFVNESVDDFIYASLTQPPIKIIDKKGSDDEMDFIVECPNCHSKVVYGDETFMIHGYIYCITDGCRERLEKRLGRNYE